jgi:hypothetical protein
MPFPGQGKPALRSLSFWRSRQHQRLVPAETETRTRPAQTRPRATKFRWLRAGRDQRHFAAETCANSTLALRLLALSSQAGGQFLYVAFDIIANAAVGFYSFAEGIVDLPIFKWEAGKKSGAGNARHVDDEVGFL